MAFWNPFKKTDYQVQYEELVSAITKVQDGLKVYGLTLDYYAPEVKEQIAKHGFELRNVPHD